MPPRAKPPELDPAAELARKVEILEREMATQRAAMERLKQMSVARPPNRSPRFELRRRPA